MRTKNLFIIISLIFLSGCISLNPFPFNQSLVGQKIMSEDTIFNNTTTNTDPYQNLTWIRSPDWVVERFVISSIPSCVAHLRAATREDVVRFYQLYVWNGSDKWSFYNRAYDSNGNALGFVLVDREVSKHGYAVHESFAINLSEKYLNDMRISGLNIKVVGKRSEKIIVVPSYFVQGFLRKVNVCIKGMKSREKK